MYVKIDVSLGYRSGVLVSSGICEKAPVCWARVHSWIQWDLRLETCACVCVYGADVSTSWAVSG